jgi:hypothetical protein
MCLMLAVFVFMLAIHNGLRSEGICEIEIKDGYTADL